MKIVLLSCVSKKLGKKSKARDLYTSSLFKKSLKYSEKLNPDKTFILSAEHHLVSLDQEIEPYNKALNKMSKEERITWANLVLEQLRGESNLEKDEFIFMAGKNYREFLTPHIKNFQVPLENLGIGKQLKFLKESS